MKRVLKKALALSVALTMLLQTACVLAAAAKDDTAYEIVSQFSTSDAMGVRIKANALYEGDFTLYAALLKDGVLCDAKSFKKSDMMSEREIAFEKDICGTLKIMAWDNALAPVGAAYETELVKTSVSVSAVGANGDSTLSDEGESAAQITVPSYASGDILRFSVSGADYIWVKAATNLPEYLVYVPHGTYDFPIPSGEPLHGYNSANFKGEQTVGVRAASRADIKTYRNVALNGVDYMYAAEKNSPTAKLYTLPSESAAVESGAVMGYPHAYANRVTRNEGAFYAHNAIDGITRENSHGYYPSHSWGGGDYEDALYCVYFGREVEVDKIVLTLRSDYHETFAALCHDTYWEGMVAEFSDGSEIAIKPVKNGLPQEFSFKKRTTNFVRLKKLAVHEDVTTQMYAALSEMEVWGSDEATPRVTSDAYEAETIKSAVENAIASYSGTKGSRYMAALAKAYTALRSDEYYDALKAYAVSKEWLAADSYDAQSFIELWKASPADYKITGALSYANSDKNIALAAQRSLLSGDAEYLKDAFLYYTDDIVALSTALDIMPSCDFEEELREVFASQTLASDGIKAAYALFLGIREGIFESDEYFNKAAELWESASVQSEEELLEYVLASCELQKLCADYKCAPTSLAMRDVKAVPVIEDGYLIGSMSASATAEQSGNGAANLVNNVYNDNKTGSRWAAENFPQSATIELQKEMNLDKIIIQPYGYRHYYYTLYASSDGVNYTKIGDDSSYLKHYNLATHNFEGVKARYIKLTVTGLEGEETNWVSIKEMFIYASEAEFKTDYETIMSQLKVVNDYHISANSNLAPASNPWEVAVFHTANMQAYYMTGDEAYRKYSTLWGKVNSWQAYPNPNTRLTFADNMTCMQTYIDLYNIDKDEKYIEQAKTLAATIMADTSTTARFGKDYWFWVDAFYMAAPIWTKLYKITGDRAYLDNMYELILHTAEDPARNCYDEDEHLWYRDASFVYPKKTGSDASKKIFWARGNGWVFAAFAKILEDMPTSYEHRDYFVNIFKGMAEAIKKCQCPNGGWSPSLLDYDYSPQSEESGTAFLTYGLFWGMNNSLLEKEEYYDCAMRAWKWLATTALQPNGSVGYVQPIGWQPTQTLFKASDTQHYGAGSFVMAASEAAKSMGGMQGDIYPMLQKKLTGRVWAYKADSVHYVENGELQTAAKPMVIYENSTAKLFVGGVYKNIEETLSDMQHLTKIGDMYIVSENADFFNKTEDNLALMLDEMLQSGTLPARAESNPDRIPITVRGMLEDGENMLIIPSANVYSSYTPQSENAPENIVDRLLTTRYSSESYYPIESINADGAVYGEEKVAPYVEIDLADTYDVDKIGLAFYMGAARTSDFSLSVSGDGKTFSEVLAKRSSSGTSENVEYYTFQSVKARKLRLYGYGNSTSSWFSPTELEIYAINPKSTAVTPISAASVPEKENTVINVPIENISASRAYNSSLSALCDRDFKTVFKTAPTAVAAGKTNAYIEYDLSDGCDVNRIGIAFENARSVAYSFDVEYSPDAVSYETIVPKSTSEYKDGFNYFDFEALGMKKLRFNLYGNENDALCAISEIEIASPDIDVSVGKTLRGSMSIKAAQDAYLASAEPTVAKGASDSASILVSMNAGAGAAASRRDGLLKFDLSACSAPYISSAKLKMYVKSTTNTSTRTALFYPASDTWSESTVTWSGAPEAQGSAIGSFAVEANTTNTWFETDITDYVASLTSKTFSLRFGVDTAVIYFASKEYSSAAFAPTLEIEYSAAPVTKSAITLKCVDANGNSLAATESLGERVTGEFYTYGGAPKTYIEKGTTTYMYMPALSTINILVAPEGNNTITLVYRAMTEDDFTKERTLIEQGAWCWFADPRAINHVNEQKGIDMTYIGAIDNAGTIKAFQRNNNTGEEKVVTVRTGYQKDDHDNPTFLILPDDRVMIFYSEHTSNPYYHYKISKAAGDLTALGEEKQISTSGYGNFTYPNPFIMSDQPNAFYLCWRGKNWHPTVAKYTLPDASDNVTTLINPTQIVQSTGARPYVKYQSNGKDKIYLTYTTGHPDNENPNWVYYSVLDVNTLKLYNVAGDLLGDISQTPYKVNKTNYNAKLVVDNASARDWVWDVTIADDGNPVIAMVRISADKSEHNYYYAKWTGSTWKKTFIANGGGHFHDGSTSYERCYSAGMTIDHKNPSVIYVSKPTVGAYGKVYEIYRYTMNAAWDVEKAEAITKNSKQNNVRPYIIRGTDESDNISLIWLYGKYYKWSSSGSDTNQGYPTTVKTLSK